MSVLFGGNIIIGRCCPSV